MTKRQRFWRYTWLASAAFCILGLLTWPITFALLEAASIPIFQQDLPQSVFGRQNVLESTMEIWFGCLAFGVATCAVGAFYTFDQRQWEEE